MAPGSDDRRAARIVTVSAPYGAAGSVVAPRLAEVLGLPFADRLVPATDADPPAPGGEHADEEERRQVAEAGVVARLAYLTGLPMAFPPPGDLADPVRERVERDLDRLVAAGGAVVLGRAGAVVLAGRPGAFHVRLHGPKARRVARGMEIERIDEATARARLAATDRARARYAQQLYGRDLADPGLYHLSLDTTVLALDDAVRVVATAAAAFWGRSAPPPPPAPGGPPAGERA